ncbi:MAG: alpha/beta hydrolase [Deltaproteobacteria bacterium]|nr:alpha/beta hydrolase [Deltaproteobacteria bacterium]
MTLIEDIYTLPGFTEGFAEINSARLHYVSVGQGELMLFVHGFPEFWGEWAEQLAEFGRDCRAVAFDMRGYNLSSRPSDSGEYHVLHLIEDIRGLVRHLGHDTFTLVAHDWGGAVAWAFANRYPDMVDRLVVINAPHGAVFARELLNNPAQREASQYMLLLRGPEAEEKLARNDYAWPAEALWGDGSRWRAEERDRLKYAEAWSRPGAMTGAVNYYRASPLYPPTTPEDETRLQGILDLDKKMFQVVVPTLVIWGEQDHALLIGNLDGLEDYVPDLTVARIPDGTHWVVHERAEEVNRLIRAFIQ